MLLKIPSLYCFATVGWVIRIHRLRDTTRVASVG